MCIDADECRLGRTELVNGATWRVVETEQGYCWHNAATGETRAILDTSAQPEGQP